MVLISDPLEAADSGGGEEAVRVLFLGVDGVMISRSTQRNVYQRISERQQYGLRVTPDRSARLALGVLLGLTGAKVCLASSWLWHTLKDGTSGADLSIQRLALQGDQWHSPPTVFDPKGDRQAFNREHGRNPDYSSMPLLIRTMLDDLTGRGVDVQGWAFVDDDPYDLFRYDKSLRRNFVKVDSDKGFDITTAMEACRRMGVPLKSETLPNLHKYRQEWWNLRSEDLMNEGEETRPDPNGPQTALDESIGIIDLDLMEIGHRIRERRKRFGLTVVDLASALKVSFGTIDEIERGSSAVSIGDMMRAARTVGVDFVAKE